MPDSFPSYQRMIATGALLALFFLPLHSIDDTGSIVEKAYAKGGGGAGAGSGAGAGAGAGGVGAGAGGAGGGGVGYAVNTEIMEAFLRSPQALRTASPPDAQNVEILEEFRNARGQRCRVVEQTVMIGSRQTRASGTVCQQTDGHWAIAR